MKFINKTLACLFLFISFFANATPCFTLHDSPNQAIDYIKNNPQKILDDCSKPPSGVSDQAVFLKVNALARLFLTSDYENALKQCFQAIQIEESENDIKGQVISNIFISVIFEEIKNEDKALEYLKKASDLSLQEKTGLFAADILSRQALIHLKKNKIDEALEAHDKALTLYETAGEKQQEATTLYHMGNAYLMASNDEIALAKHLQSLAIRRSLENKKEEAQSLMSLGNVYHVKKDLPQAFANYIAALEIYKAENDQAGMAECYNVVGLISLSQKDYPRALGNLNLGLKYSEGTQDKNGLMNSYKYLGDYYQEVNDYKKALEFKNKYLAINDFIVSENNERKVDALETQFEIDKKDNELSRQKYFQNLLFMGLAMVLIISIFIYYLYRQKGKSNQALSLVNIQINQQKKELEELNHMKDKFFSIISHDLKGPLNSLTSFSNLLINHTDSLSKEEIKLLATDLDKSLKNIFNLLENLLQWARSQSGDIQYNPEIIQLSEVIHHNRELLRPAAESKKIVIQTTETRDLKAFGDRNMINTVLRNLISNSIKFTQEGGKVLVSAKSMGDEIEIAVKDSGIGMSAEAVSKIFRIDQKYTTLGTAKEKGTGLGLLVCKEFVEKAGGAISVESTEGKGTTFRFTVKVSEG